jgi:hypothetical protein
LSGPGTSSDQPSQSPGQDRRPAEQPSVERKIRVTNLYATPWQLPERTATGELADYLELWRFEQYYRLSADQLPRVLHRKVLDADTLRFSRWASRAGEAAAAWMWLFQLPSGQVIAALSIDVQGELADTIDLLEDCYFGDVQIGGTSSEEYVHTLAAGLGADGRGEARFLPERHQVVFDETPAPDDCEDLVQRLIYRADRPYRKEFSAICYPPELNRRPGWLAAVGPYVSVVCGQAGFIENAIFLSAVQAVGAAAQLRAIRHAAYTDVRLFRDLEATGASTRDRRRMLERISDQLGDLELELSYSVEASADLGLLVPSLRAENFHNALYESMGLAGKAVTAGRMLERLGAAISAELTAIGSIERRADENRRVRYAVAVGFISVVAIPASLILAYLGINASEVSAARSMFSSRYLGMYLTVAAVIVIGGVLSLVLWIQQRRDARHHRVRSERQRWALMTDEPVQ